MSDLDRRMLLGAAGLVGVAALGRMAKAGPINPPTGPVIATGKTLTEVEPRTLINATNTPGGTGAVFSISQAGSYYLGGNVAVPSGKIGISIGASDVTVDLNGYRVSGPAAGGGGSLAGISASGGSTGVTVRNGVVRQMGGTGIVLSDSSRIEDIAVIGNANGGVSVGSHCQITRVIADSNAGGTFGNAGIGVNTSCIVAQCVATNNAASGFSGSENNVFSECCAYFNATGFFVGAANQVRGCTAENNQGVGYFTSNTCIIDSCIGSFGADRGILAGFGCTLTNCVTNSNRGGGIRADENCIIERCVSSYNTNNGSTTVDGINFGQGCTIRDCLCSANGGGGIVAQAVSAGVTGGIGATIVGNSVRLNGFDGFSIVANSLVARNNSTDNGTVGGGASNFRVTGSHNRIEANNSFISSTGQGQGFYMSGATNNLIFGNSSSTLNEAWLFGANSAYGPIVDRRVTNSGAAGFGNVPSQMGTTDPFANISY